MSDTRTSPPFGLAAALDVALALPGYTSREAGERALCERMADVLFSRLESPNHSQAESAYLSELTAALWGASVALVETRSEADAQLAERKDALAKSRDALDGLAGVGRLGLSGWLARIGGLVAGFGFTQIVAELLEHEDEVRIIATTSGTLAREVEVAVVSELREPDFGILLAVSTAVAIAAALLVGVWLRWYRGRRIDQLNAELETARSQLAAETSAKRSVVVSRLVRTLVGVMERHYPGAAATEIQASTGLSVDIAGLLAGAEDDAIAAFAARHLSADPLPM